MPSSDQQILIESGGEVVRKAEVFGAFSEAIVTSIKNVEGDLDTAERLINEKIAGP